MKIEQYDLVALHGLPRAGKDTLGAHLVTHHGFRRIGFADALYREVAQTFGVKEDELRSHEWKTKPQNLLTIRCSDCPKYRAMMTNMGFDPDEPRTSRFHTRHWATEYRRAQDPFYWVQEVAEAVALMKNRSIVVTDLRFANTEFPFLRNFAKQTNRIFTTIEITSPLSEPADHTSDDRLPQMFIDMTIDNVVGQPEIMIGRAVYSLGLQRIAA